MIKKISRFALLLCLLYILLVFTGCDSNLNTSVNSAEQSSPTSNTQTDYNEENSPPQTENNTKSEEHSESKMKVQIANQTFTATLEENAAAQTFLEMIKREPVVIEMSDYSGFEKVGSLGTNLPTSNNQTTTHEGDIVLYNGNQIVIFYGSNTWSYTRLGKIDDLTGWKEALGNGDVTVTFTV